MHERTCEMTEQVVHRYETHERSIRRHDGRATHTSRSQMGDSRIGWLQLVQNERVGRHDIPCPQAR